MICHSMRGKEEEAQSLKDAQSVPLRRKMEDRHWSARSWSWTEVLGALTVLCLPQNRPGQAPTERKPPQALRQRAACMSP